MKRSFTLLLAALFMLMTSLAFGQTREEVVAYTLDGTITGGSSGYATESTITQNGMTWMVTGNTTINPWRIGGKNLSGVDRPLYSTSAMSDNITKVVITNGSATATVNSMTLYVSSSGDFSDPTTVTGSFSAGSTTTFERPAATDWTNKYFKLVYNITAGSSNQYAQLVKAEFYKENGGQQTVATPTFSPAAGTYYEAQNVTIGCTTDGATIHYTLDGNDPTTSSTVYSTPIAISQTTTVKAMAVKSGMNNSTIASATYTIEAAPSVITIAAARALALNEYALVQGIVTFIDGTNIYVQDETAGIDLYLNSGTVPSGLALGDKVQAYGKKAVYKGLIELSGINGGEASQFSIISTGNTLPLAEKTIAEILADHAGTQMLQSTRVQIVNATIGTINTSNNTPLTQGESTTNIYKVPSLTGITAGDAVDVIGVIGCYNAPQLRVAYASDVTIHQNPTYNVTVATGITNGTVTVDPATAEEGATITVTATPDSGYELATLTYTYGTTTDDIDMVTMQFVMPGADVTVNATFSELEHVANPTFAPVAGTYLVAQEVSIACATDGATIHYTTDGTDPTTESPVYSEAFMVNATTTVKALAVKEGMNDSEISSATYTIMDPITIAEARVLANNQYALVQGVVTFIDGRNIYVQDETAGIVLFLNNNTVPAALALGDMVLGYGKKTVYKGLVELSDINGGSASQFVIVSNGNTLPVAEKTIAEILADHSGSKMLQSTRVQIVNATVGTINTSNNTPITQGESTLNIYKMPAVSGLEQGDYMTVTGIIGCYNDIQLRVAYATDITYTHPAGITVNPTSLGGFTYVYGEGPSTVKTFVINGRSLAAPTYIHASENYEISSFPGASFYPESIVTINTYTGTYTYTIKVRLKAGLEAGTYNESLMICENELDTIYFALTGNVTGEQPQPTGDYTRISNISEVTTGSKVVFAARYNENANEYYAMTAQASGKPEGVLFTSETADGEILPAAITDVEETFYWTVDTDGTNFTFTNANGDVLGYPGSGTNFSAGGDNTAWTIESGIADTAAMVPSYEGFVVTNVNNSGRAIALNSNHNYGPYAKSNMTNSNASNYNFFLDIFATAGGGTPVCATPAFSPEAGTYYEAQEVTITCATADATIHYTLDGSDPDETSAVYSEPISVEESMTIKAIAMKEGYDNSNIATAEYTIIIGAVTIFNQDWEGEMNGWTFVTVEGNKPWNIGLTSNNHYALANGYNDTINNVQWCISPAFDLNVYSNASLTFRNATKFTGPALELYFTNNYDGENPATATWVPLTFAMSTGNYTWVESGTISLAEYAGESCYIGFKYTSMPGTNNAAAWEVDDIVMMGFTSNPVLSVTPNNLDGFSYIVGNGPSAEMTLNVNGMNLSENVTLTLSFASFEMSLTSGDAFSAQQSIVLTPEASAIDQTIYVRMAEGLSMGEYLETITISSQLDDIIVNLSGSVIEEGESWNRIAALNNLHDGDLVIIASRYDASIGNGYYAMTAGVSGKPDGVLFTSENNNGTEMLPAEIANAASTFMWTVSRDADVIVLVNAAGDSLGYSSSTNFSGNVQTEWNIALETSSENALIPNYTGFVITNAETTNRGIAKNASNKFGPYAISNINNTDYNFYLDLFVQGGVVTPTAATPVFSLASGTYYEAIEVEITCSTEGATIYYTTDGSDPTASSTVYAGSLSIDETTTVKAIAMMEGYDNSNIATASYIIMSGTEIILNQDWEGEMNGWTFVTVEGNKPWIIGSYNNNHYANANGYNDDTDNEQWCISPAFDLDAYATQNVILTFRNAVKYDGPALELYFSNDYNGEDPTSATWAELDYIASEGNYTWTESGEIALNEFSGNNCYIGFRYISTLEAGAAAWEIDDIMVVANGPLSVNTPEAAMNVEVWNNHNELMIMNGSNSTMNVMVYNLVGQPVLSSMVTAGSNVIRHNLAEGVYIVRIADGKEVTCVKTVVRR